MTDKTADRILEEIAGVIEIPDSAYETAEARYQDLGQWFGRPESKCSQFDPHISLQGSFRLGTVNRPLNGEETYDLDLVCNLKRGICKSVVTQEQLKRLVGLDIESYREARHLEEEKKEKHRCCDLTGAFCTSRREREFTRRTAGYANQEVQSRTDRDDTASDRSGNCKRKAHPASLQGS
jgi:hypothetical protein